MRTLTGEQKKLARKWFNSNYPEKTGYCKFDLVDKMDGDIYEKIENIHPTEIHYQNMNNYLESLVSLVS